MRHLSGWPHLIAASPLTLRWASGSCLDHSPGVKYTLICLDICVAWIHLYHLQWCLYQLHPQLIRLSHARARKSVMNGSGIRYKQTCKKCSTSDQNELLFLVLMPFSFWHKSLLCLCKFEETLNKFSKLVNISSFVSSGSISLGDTIFNMPTESYWGRGISRATIMTT